MTEPKWWEKEAHAGIIGLGAPPWENPTDELDWPTGGYDDLLAVGMWDEEVPLFERSTHTKAEWIELADEMLSRWTAWKAYITEMPDDPL